MGIAKLGLARRLQVGEPSRDDIGADGGDYTAGYGMVGAGGCWAKGFSLSANRWSVELQRRQTQRLTNPGIVKEPVRDSVRLEARRWNRGTTSSKERQRSDTHP